MRAYFFFISGVEGFYAERWGVGGWVEMDGSDCCRVEGSLRQGELAAGLVKSVCTAPSSSFSWALSIYFLF